MDAAPPACTSTAVQVLTPATSAHGVLAPPPAPSEAALAAPSASALTDVVSETESRAAATAAAEAAILASITQPARIRGGQPGTGGLRKRQRDVARREVLCREFGTAQGCTYGDACRYGHRLPTRGGAFVDAGGGAGASDGFGALVAPAPAAAAAVDGGSDAVEPDAEGLETGTSLPLVRLPGTPPPTPEARYYSRLYLVDARGVSGADFYAHIHSNRVVVLGIAPSHALVRARVPLVDLRFATGTSGTGGRHPLTGVAPEGKRKRGGHFVDLLETLAVARTEDGVEWPLLSVARGAVVEVNSLLLPQAGGERAEQERAAAASGGAGGADPPCVGVGSVACVGAAAGGGSSSGCCTTCRRRKNPLNLLIESPESDGFLAIMMVRGSRRSRSEGAPLARSLVASAVDAAARAMTLTYPSHVTLVYHHHSRRSSPSDCLSSVRRC